MPTMTIVRKSRIDTAELAAAGQRAGADAGDPQLRVQSIATQGAGRFGIWECQPGGWPVVDRTDTEVAFILSGTAVLTDDQTGDVSDIGAGDMVILPVGWTGRWDVKTTVKKLYAIY